MSCGHHPVLLGVLEAVGWHIEASASCRDPPKYTPQALCMIRACSKQYCVLSVAGLLALSALYIIAFLMQGSMCTLPIAH